MNSTYYGYVMNSTGLVNRIQGGSLLIVECLFFGYYLFLDKDVVNLSRKLQRNLSRQKKSKSSRHKYKSKNRTKNREKIDTLQLIDSRPVVI